MLGSHVVLGDNNAGFKVKLKPITSVGGVYLSSIPHYEVVISTKQCVNKVVC